VYGRNTPTVGIPIETAGARGEEAREGASRIGADGSRRIASSAREILAAVRTDPMSGNITANGFSSRRFRPRRARTTSSFVASAASWGGPSPLTATIAPRISSAAAVPRGSSAGTASPPGPRSDSRGPHSGQALGSAWNRRFDGSPYSLRQSGHIGKADIEVRSRSYGSDETMVKRGPQFVQLVNG